MYEQLRRQARETIIDTSIALFRKNGYDSVSVEEITKAVGIAKGTFYNFFSSKRDILMAWSAMKFSGLDVSEAISQQNTAEQNILRLVDVVTREIASEAGLFASFLKEIVQADAPAQAEAFDFRQALEAAIRGSRDFDAVGEKDLGTKAQALSSLLFFEMLRWFRGGSAADGLAEHLKAVLSVCINGIYKQSPV